MNRHFPAGTRPGLLLALLFLLAGPPSNQARAEEEPVDGVLMRNAMGFRSGLAGGLSDFSGYHGKGGFGVFFRRSLGGLLSSEVDLDRNTLEGGNGGSRLKTARTIRTSSARTGAL